MQYSTFPYSCDTWVEFRVVVGCLLMNIFNALLLSCPRNKLYTRFKLRQIYDLFFFLRDIRRLLLLVFVNKSPELLCHASSSLYPDVPHHSYSALPVVWGKAFVANLCNDFCVTSSTGVKGSKSSMQLYTPQLYAMGKLVFSEPTLLNIYILSASIFHLKA